MAQGIDQSEKYAGQGVLASNDSTVHQYETRYNPWVLTCERWSQLAQYIALPINPSDIAWHIPLKVATEQTGRATVSYIWRNNYLNVSSDGGTSSQDSLLQDFELALTFNSGNIAPMFNAAKAKSFYEADASTTGQAWSYRPDPKANSGELAKFDDYSAMGNDVLTQRVELPDESGYVLAYDETVPLGVQNLYRVLSLLDEPKITYVPGSNRGAIRSNRICLVMNTPAFPNMVVYGHANPSGVSWEESADSPNTFDITFTITVTETQPKLGMSGLTSLLTTYKAAVGADGNPITTRDQLYATQQNGKVSAENSKKATATQVSAVTAKDALTNVSQHAGDVDPILDSVTLADQQIEIENAVDEVLQERAKELQAARDAQVAQAKEDAFDARVDKLANTQVVKTAAANSSEKQIKALFNSMVKSEKVSAEDRSYYSGIFDKNSGYTKAEKIAIIASVRSDYRTAAKSAQVAGKIPGASRKGAQSS